MSNSQCLQQKNKLEMIEINRRFLDGPAYYSTLIFFASISIPPVGE